MDANAKRAERFNSDYDFQGASLDDARANKRLGPDMPEPWLDKGQISKEVYGHLLWSDGESMGRLTRKRGRPIADIATELRAALDAKDPEILRGFDYFGPLNHARAFEWPAEVKWISCYAVTGGNEGHYVHVDLVLEPKGAKAFEHKGVFLGKTFAGIDAALRLAAELTKLLNA